MKINRFYLVIIIAVLLFTGLPLFAQDAFILESTPQFETVSSDELEVIRLTNELRADLGLPCLAVDDSLVLAAQRHSQDMVDRNYFNHTAPEPAPYGAKFSARAIAAGYTGSPRGENIAAGYNSPQSVFEGWVNSSGHYANMVADATEIGVGYAYGANASYGGIRWTMVLGKGATSGGPCDPTLVLTPNAATNLGVNGNLDTPPARPTFTWTHDETTTDEDIPADWYHIVVMANGTTHIDQWRPTFAASYGYNPICTGTTCTFTPAAADISTGDGLMNGTYSWYVESYAFGSNTIIRANGNNFSATPGPGAITITGPAQGSTVQTSRINVTWNEDPKAEWYHLFVMANNATMLDQWVPASEACGTGCEYDFGASSDGSYELWMAAWGPGGMGPYNTQPRTFSVGIPAPAAPENLNVTPDPTESLISWSPVADGSWYQVQISKGNTTIYDNWHEASTVCGTQCEIVWALANGGYELRVRAWTGVLSSWATLSFDISLNDPGAPTGHSPSNGASISSGNTSLMWNQNPDVGWYYVYLGGPGGALLNNWYKASDICSGTCSIDAGNLGAGEYDWWMAVWGPGTTNIDYTNTTFTVN